MFEKNTVILISCCSLLALLLIGTSCLLIHAQSVSSDVAAAMSLVPEGDFWMGRNYFWLLDELNWTERPRLDDRPVHRVYVDAFYMDKYEVTNEAYARFVDARSLTKPYHWDNGKIPAGKERWPVYNVTWDDAQNYCSWAGKRLPTEAEWERAARGGLERKFYPWGDDFPNTSEAGENGGGTSGPKKKAHTGFPNGPTNVGSYPPNGFGLYDMTGNVWEWIQDWYGADYYSVSDARNPRGPETGIYRVIRGSGWSEINRRIVMVHHRNYTKPSTLAPTIGFRCVKPVSEGQTR